MRLFAIDPGPETCGVVLLDVDEWPPKVLKHRAKMPVEEVLEALRNVRKAPGGRSIFANFPQVACERVASYNQIAGNEVLQTCEVFGDIRATCRDHGIDFTPIFRREVKMRLGLQVSVGDPEVSTAIRELYPATGGGKKPQVGIKSKPGPLYGLSFDAWAALGVGLAWVLEREREQRAKELAALKSESAQRGLEL